MTKSILSSTLLLFLSLILTNPASAQFNFGDIIQGEARQVVREIERQVVDQIQDEWRPRHQVLPYDPPIIVEPPRCQQPRPIYPVHPQPIVEPTPVVQPPAPPTRGGGETKQPRLPEVEIGSQVTIDGEKFGKQPGGVFVKIDRLILTAELTAWDEESAEAQLPSLPLVEPTPATVIVMTANEEIAERLDVMLLPASETSDEGEEPEVAEAPLVHAGQEIALEGEFGESAGRVELSVGSFRLQAAVVAWSDSEITVQLPQLVTEGIHDAQVAIFNSEGELADEIEVRFATEAQ